MPVVWALKTQNEAKHFQNEMRGSAVAANAAAHVWPIACLA
jgi:hypothetical protein